MFAGVMFAIGVILRGLLEESQPRGFPGVVHRNNVFIMRAIPFVALPTFIGLVRLALAWLEQRDERALWLVPSANRETRKKDGLSIGYFFRNSVSSSANGRKPEDGASSLTGPDKGELSYASATALRECSFS
jgi:hypothetical protein